MTTDATSLQGAVAVVSGAQRGLGPHFVYALLSRGATVHALSRVPQAIAHPGVSTSRLDVTDPDSIASEAARAPRATLVINNEVLRTGARLVDGDLRDIDLEMETNFYGALGVIRAFAPILAANGAGTILNVHTLRDVGAHAGTEAAARAMTELSRAELAAYGIRVVGLHVGLDALDDLLDEGTQDIVADRARVAA